jgi:hypothetical protein
LTYRECGIRPNEAARKAGLAITTAKDIWKRAGEIEISYAEQDLPLPLIKELVAVKPKTGRPKVLSDEDCDKIFVAYIVDKKARKKRFHHVSLEEGFKAC